MLTNDAWVAVSKEIMKGIAEFTTTELKEHLNTEKYTAVPIQEYLHGLNTGKYAKN